jgi:hypothetical protein
MDLKAISEQIDKILNSQSFAGKSQLKKLLEILFARRDSQTTLKPDRVIKELWPEEAGTKGSADVATEMNRLRKALELYYSGEGKTDLVVIALPNRSVPGPDGTKEKRWIVAEPRGIIEVPLPLPVRRVKPRKKLEMAGAIALLSIVCYFSVRLLASDRRPYSARMDAARLVIMNAEGKELWSKSFPDGFWSEYYDQGLATRTWFGDLEGKGNTDVLLLYHPAVNPSAHSTTLICYSDQGKEKWRWTPGRNLPELQGTPALFTTVGLSVLKAKHGEHARIVLASRHSVFYPGQIAMVDSNGKTISEYWHSGNLNHLVLADLNGDGREQIIATGISNGYRQATLVVLDPDRVYGASTEAARPEIQIHGMGVAAERIRLLFSRSDLNKALSVYNEAEEPVVEHGRMRLSVKECADPTCTIVYEFDTKFHLVSVVAYDHFRNVHKEFYLRSKSDHPFNAEEEAEFQKVRCLVGCESELVMNDIH